MLYQKILLLAVSFITVDANTQTITKIGNEKMQSFKTARVAYSNEKGHFFGAGNSVDADYIIVIFKEVLFDKENSTLKIQGVTYETLAEDPLRLNGAEIFTAIPKGDKLRDLKSYGFSKTSDKHDNTDGNFEISFKVKKKYRLYFDGGNGCYLLEYDIWDLIKHLN